MVKTQSVIVERPQIEIFGLPPHTVSVSRGLREVEAGNIHDSACMSTTTPAAKSGIVGSAAIDTFNHIQEKLRLQMGSLTHTRETLGSCAVSVHAVISPFFNLCGLAPV